MINTLVLDRSSQTFTHVSNPDLISVHCSHPSDIVWVDVSDPTSEDFEELAREFGFHPLAIEDCRNEHQRPKVEEYPGYYFIVLYEAEMKPGCPLELRELNIFLGPNYLVTVHSQPIRNIEKAQHLWRRWADVSERKTGLPAYLLMDAIIDDYMPMLDDFSDRLDELEAQIFENFQPEALHDIFRIKKQLIFLRRAVVPLRDVFNTLLRREQPVFSRETMIYFQDVYDHLIRVADSIDALREIVGSAMEAYLSVSGNRMNFVMKRLTSISAILMSVTLIAGIYGMNFQFMPELGWRYGYVGALVSMLLVGLALYFYFRKIKWL
ncbi:MAG: Cobalt/magnesium transport protein CorA [Acidobacteria bacterium]|nr:Cobalt/magnesium transport protein CorA [Acidobacteriota bacterium]